MSKRLTAERLEQLGQLRLPGIDQLRDLVCTLGTLIVEVAKVATAKVTETAKSITARVGRVLLVLSGDEREMYDRAAVEAEIAGQAAEDAIAHLIGMGFDERGRAAA